MNPIKISQGGKLETSSKIKVTQKNLAEVYTPGVAQVCLAIKKKPEKVRDLTWKNRSVAIVSDGTAILGLGNIGPEAGLPVMEAKALLFKQLGGIDAVPIMLNTNNPKEIIRTVKNIAAGFGGINLEDIAAPNCFQIEKALRSLPIPAFHDDQDGTAIVTLAGLINATKVVGKNLKTTKIIISGAGAAGIAIARLLLAYGCKNITLFDSQGSIYQGRKGLNFIKKEIAQRTNLTKENLVLKKGIKEADIFIGVSGPKLLNISDIRKMKERAIVFAMANPTPEIMPEIALKGGAAIVATGRSDFPNQINNALVFPGIFKGALKNEARAISQKHKLAAAISLSSLIKNPTKNNLLPKVTDRRAVEAVAKVFQ
ncbi:MAG TPA: NADP-dependent malic enzyme [Candidatus Moranbacteria bacterium]|nr:NADP-dependent malic enzyme [Candidatus Moranbacteria bacterium]